MYLDSTVKKEKEIMQCKHIVILVYQTETKIATAIKHFQEWN